MGRNVEARNEEAWALARKQHWVISRRQLLNFGFTPRAIEHWLETFRLHRVYRGVYAVGTPQLDRHRRWMAAVLASGPRAVLSHRSAGELWGLVENRERDKSEVTVRGPVGSRRTQISAVSRPALPATESTVHEGIPVTTPARTLLDLATVLDELQLERAVNEADKLDLISSQVLRLSLEKFGGERGVRALRKLFERDSFRLSDSTLEILFRRLADESGLPAPQTRALVNGFTVDFYWPEFPLIVETDGLRYHRTAATQSRDRLRDQAHTAAGITCLRFTHWQVQHQSDHVRQILRKTANRLRQTPDA